MNLFMCDEMTRRDQANLKLLNLTYDVMPSSFITVVLTEYAEIPPTAVQSINRQYNEELN